jgi:uncharacterized membrane protein YfcA
VESTTLVVLSVIFLATFIRSAFGFGEALIAVPLLALVMPVEVATPLAVLMSITVAGIVVAQDWRKVHFRSAVWLVLSSLPGIPLGLALLTGVEEWLVKIVLGAVIVAFSTLLRSGPSRRHWQRTAGHGSSGCCPGYWAALMA